MSNLKKILLATFIITVVVVNIITAFYFGFPSLKVFNQDSVSMARFFGEIMGRLLSSFLFAGIVTMIELVLIMIFSIISKKIKQYTNK